MQSSRTLGSRDSMRGKPGVRAGIGEQMNAFARAGRFGDLVIAERRGNQTECRIAAMPRRAASWSSVPGL